MLEGSVAAGALVVAVAVVAILAGLAAAGAVVVLAGLCGGCGWLMEGRRMNREENAK